MKTKKLERVDLGFWQLPKPPDPLAKYRKTWERIPNLAIRGTVPFGYMLDPEDNDWLLPIDQELSLLELAKKHLKRYPCNEVAAWLTTQSGRSISDRGLQRRVEIDRRRKKLANLKRFYAKRYAKIIEQIEELEHQRTGAAKENGQDAI